MDNVGDGMIKLGTLTTRPDCRFNLDSPEVSVSSPVTRQKAAAAATKQFIENHYKNYLQGLQDCKERAARNVEESARSEGVERRRRGDDEGIGTQREREEVLLCSKSNFSDV
ncbi:unnamed protein product [Camellia sinensis]